MKHISKLKSHQSTLKNNNKRSNKTQQIAGNLKNAISLWLNKKDNIYM